MTKEDIAAARAVRKSAGMVAEERENLNKLSPIL